MRQYLDTLRHVRDNGVEKGDRTGTGTTEVFGVQTRYDLADGFPAMTTKKLYFNSVAHELLWFLKGTGNIEYLAQNGVHIWDEWPYKNYLEKTGQSIPEINGEEWRAGMKEFIGKIATDHAFAEEWGNLGPVYGVQWRKWPDGKGGTIDQIQNSSQHWLVAKTDMKTSQRTASLDQTYRLSLGRHNAKSPDHAAEQTSGR